MSRHKKAAKGMQAAQESNVYPNYTTLNPAETVLFYRQKLADADLVRVETNKAVALILAVSASLNGGQMYRLRCQLEEALQDMGGGR